MSRSKKLAAVSTAALVLAMGACGKSGGDTESADGVKLGPGVKDGTITLGVLTDLSGVFAPLGKDSSTGYKLYFDQVNADGGVCDAYDVKLNVQDSGYVVQKSVQQYGAVHDDVAALIGTMGSPANVALLPKVEADEMTNLAISWDRKVTDWKGNIILGGAFDVDIANGVDYLVQESIIGSGDTVGHIYFQGDYGESALTGTELAANKHGLKVVKAQIDPTDSDMSAQVARMKSQNVDAIVLSASPTQTASVMTAASGQGWDVPVLSSMPGFAPGLMDSPAASALKKSFYLASPLATTLPADTELGEKFAEANKGVEANNSHAGGVASAQIIHAILEKACEEKDLTRKGILDAKVSMGEFNTDGLVVPLDLSKVGASPTLKTNIQRPSDEPGGLTQVAAAFQGESAVE